MGLIFLLITAVGFFALVFSLLGFLGKAIIFVGLPLLISLIAGGLAAEAGGRPFGFFVMVGTLIALVAFSRKISGNNK